MTTAALRGLLGRKLRTVLTAFAIVLGVGMVSGSYVLTDTMAKAFHAIFQSSYQRTDAVVSGRKFVDYSESGNASVSPALLARVKRLPGVAAAAGEVIDFNDNNSDEAKIIDKNGKVISGNGNPTFGFGLDPAQPRFNPLKLASGRWAVGRGEVVIDAGTAHKHGFRVGDPIRIAVNGQVRRFRLVGLARLGDLDTIGSATISVFDVPTAQALLHKSGYDSIAVAAKPGVSARELIARIRPILPATAQVKSGAEQAKSDEKGASEFIKLFRYFLLGFGGIALFVGAFVIFNTLSITIAQRTRELATLRTLGASRRQVLGSVVLEASVLGFVAAVMGLGLGIGLGIGLSAVFTALGIDLPKAGTVIATRTIVVSLLAGTLVTVVSGLFPAVRATRIAPISAVQEGAAVRTAQPMRRTLALALVLVGLSAAGFGYSLVGGGISAATRLLLLGGGVLGLFVGVAMLAPWLVAPLAAVVGRPSALFGGAAGRLAHANTIRNPGRTAATAAALMIGLALVTFVAVFGHGLRVSDARAVKRQLDADYVVLAQNSSEKLPARIDGAVARIPGVALASGVRGERARFGDASHEVSGVDPATIGSVYRFHWSSGSQAALPTLGLHGAIVRKGLADDSGLSVGVPFTLTTPAGKQFDLVVRGIYDPPQFDPVLGEVVVSQRAFDRAFERPADSFVLVRSSLPQANLAQALKPLPEARLLTQAGFARDRTKDLADFLNVLYVMLALSVVVSLFGMVNTLVLSVFERTREIGMLRAVGLTRRQTRRMVRHESVITALIGGALGIALGIGLALAVTTAFAKYGMAFSIPTRTLAIFALVAAAGGIVAAAAPARRASRLNVLEALQYE